MSNAFSLYRDTDSAVERLDPRAKICTATVIVVALIVADSLQLRSLVVVALLVGWTAGRVGLRLLAVSVGSLAFFFVTTMTLRAVIRGQAAADAVPLGPVRYSPSGALDGLAMCLQILGVVLVLALLVRTTSPVLLAGALERLLAPVKRFGVPAHEPVMMFSIALRFLPIMFREIGRMHAAQLARGGGVQRGGIRGRAGTVLPMVIPVVIVALVRARELAEAMESRGYRGDVNRTHVYELSFGAIDLIIMLVSAAVLVAAAGTRLW